MKKDLPLFIILLIVFFTLLIIYVNRGGHYPIALVHGEWISARQFSREHTAYASYYQEFGEANRLVITDNEIFRQQVGRDGLDRLIESVLIERGIRDIPGRDAEKSVSAIVSAQINDPNIDSVRNLFGDISNDEFVGIVLRPLAQKEVLRNYLESQGKTIDVWLKSVRKTARVGIFSDLFEWNGEKVIIKS